ncbi:MAG TPA: EamA family transporter [Hyphomonadaceae bacterium]|nr:EamA family transporter [Hyphomonadaceae bacterium]
MLDSWLFWALLSALFASLTAIFGKIGVTGVDPDYATLLRVIVIAVFAGVLVFARGVAQPLTQLAPRTLIFLGLSGLATGVSWLCYYRALSLGQAGQVAPIDKLSVVLVAILGVAFLGESLNWKNWLGVGLVAGGAVLVGLKG